MHPHSSYEVSRTRFNKLRVKPRAHVGVVWLHWLGPVRYSVTKAFRKHFYLHLPPAIFFTETFPFQKFLTWAGLPHSKVFKELPFFKTFFHKAFLKGLPTYSPSFFERGDKGDEVLSTLSLSGYSVGINEGSTRKGEI